MDAAGIVVFTVGTLVLLWFSRRSLRLPGSHGFWRFLAWECMLAVVVLVLPIWFDDPLSPRQVLSWILLTASLLLALHGFRLLGRRGRPSEERKEAGLIGVERTTRLVTEGAYRYIRHPLYASLLLFAWGVVLKSPGWLTADLALASTAFLALTARAEEVENLRYFAEEYREYMRRTRMFIPGVW